MRILHLSDLHAKKVGGKLTDLEICFKNLCEQVEKIQGSKLIDFIFITGDLVDRGGKSFSSLSEGYDIFNNLLIEPLLKITGLDKSRLLFAPGNHDVEGSRIPDKFDDNHPMTRESDVNWIIEQILNQTDIGADAIGRLESFNNFASGFAADSLPEDMKMCSPLANHFLYDVNGHRVGISCLCSPWRCDKHGETKNLVLGLKQMNEADLFMNRADCTIALMHHDPFLFAHWESSMVKNVILKKYDILFLGHTHISDDTELKNHLGRTAFCCASGIITTNTGDKDYKNGFEVIDVDIDKKKLEIRKFIHNEDGSFSQDLNFVDGGVDILEFGSKKKIRPLHKILESAKDHDTALIPCEKVEAVKTALLNPDTKNLLIGAFSGLGKTRLIFDIADERRRNAGMAVNPAADAYAGSELFFYCEQSLDSEEFRKEINDFVYDHRDDSVVLILDNVDPDVFRSIYSAYRYKRNIRFIGLTNKVLDIAEDSPDYISISPNDMKPYVDKYIDDSVANRDDSLTVKSDIKQFAHGFPMLAIALTEKYNNGGAINLHDADELLNICWNDQGNRDPNESQMLMLISLFQPFPPGDDVFEAISGSKYFSCLGSLDRIDRLHLRKKIINKYNGKILEVTEGGMTVRPYPLAMHLAKLWLKEYGDPLLLEELGKYINSLEERLQNLIVDCMCNRLRKMDDDASAVSLVDNLVGESGFFGYENIVCSELGSRLILAMSTVNPLAVSKTLHRIFALKSPEEIRDLLPQQSRWNLFSALRYIIFNAGSFEYGIEILGKLALAETETYSNNSLNTFIDAFHIFLPGTELNLTERLRIIRKFADSDSYIHRLTPLAIKGALAFGSFMRSGGNRFGSGYKEDFKPSNKEVLDYWKGTIAIAIEMMEKGEFLDHIADIISSNLLVWSAKGLTPWILPLLEAFGNTDGFRLNLSEKDWLNFVSNVERYSVSQPDIIQRVNDLHHLYINENFIAELEKTAYRFHENVRFSAEDYWYHVEEYFIPLAHKFVDKNVCEDSDIMIKLLVDKGMHANYLVHALNKVLTDENLAALWNAIYRIVAVNENLEDSTFIAFLVSAAKERKPTADFLEQLYSNGFFNLYIASMARSEMPDLSHLETLKIRFATKDFISEYLARVNVYLNEDFINNLFGFLDENFDEAPLAILEFAHRNSLWMNDMTANVQEIISRMLIKADISDFTPVNERNFWELATNILQHNKDSELVKALNHKALQRFANNNFDSEAERFYEMAFKEYPDIIWDEFAENLFGDNMGLYWHISHAYGPYSLAPGMLFNLPEKYLLDALDKYPDRAPDVLAAVCPLYDITESGAKFAKWAQYLIDRYGEREGVLEHLSCNMGSFSWTGSVIPLYRRQIDVLTPLLQHSKENVRNWAKIHIEGLKKEIAREQSNEDFDRLRYEN